MIDLRSDTITKPTDEMRQAMAEAEVGDDVFSEDPTANALQKKVAGMFGFDAGLFVPSGTMGNQLCLNILTESGDEVLIEETGHIANYESTSAAHLSSLLLHTFPGDRGKLSVEQIEDSLRGDFDWEPRSKVLALEHSTNKGGGSCYSDEELEELRQFADDSGLYLHLDGARIWNAMLATDTDPEFFGTIADTLSVCFSKGLGAPVGSMILSTRENIKKARRIRKMWGGGMRQIGVLAAAADYALEYHLPELEEDHRRARVLAETIAASPQLSIDPDSVETNILIFKVDGMTAQAAVQQLEEEGVLLTPFGPQTLRATFHLEIDDEDVGQLQKAFVNCFG